jgi:hypothetical protein
VFFQSCGFYYTTIVTEKSLLRRNTGEQAEKSNSPNLININVKFPNDRKL